MAKTKSKNSPAKLDKKDLPTVLVAPLVTEKTNQLQGAKRPVYTFMVSPGANKVLARAAVVKTYGVKPVMVNIVNVKPRKIILRGGAPGHQAGFKKVLVYLRSGDKINL